MSVAAPNLSKLNPLDQAAPGTTRGLRGVTVVFVGGQVRLVDGTELDSRQATADRPLRTALRLALVTSDPWWQTISSIVLATLADRQGFAMILGPRSLSQASADGEFRRTLLRRRLAGGVGKLSLLRSDHRGRLPAGHHCIAELAPAGDEKEVLGAHVTPGSPRWRFFDGHEFYLQLVPDRLGAQVVVDGTGGFVAALGRTDTGRLAVRPTASPGCHVPRLLVLPDTTDTRQWVEDALAWRPVRTGAHLTESSNASSRPIEYRPADYLRLPVASARCFVTGLVRDGHWEDGAGLEAARLLLQERYDLKLGLWDLAMNPVLRAAALGPAALPRAPEESPPVPDVAYARAVRAADAAMARRRARESGTRVLTRTLHKLLADTGWRKSRNTLQFWLSEPIRSRFGCPASPLAELSIDILKHRLRVVASHVLAADLDLGIYVEERIEAFEAVARCAGRRRSYDRVELCCVDAGWGSTGTDWAGVAATIASHTKSWAALLAEFVRACRVIRRANSRSRRTAREGFDPLL